VCHATAASQVGARSAPASRSQSGALYNVAFYVGSAVGGWALGLPFEAAGWWALTAVALCAVTASLVIALAWPRRLRVAAPRPAPSPA
jgi:MFS transporter, YNFM family, putative membrane transport protein